MIKSFFFDGRLHKGMSYEEYTAHMEKIVASATYQTSASSFQEYFKLNLQRTRRIAKTYQVSSHLKQFVEGIDQKMIWMVITEPWCGDSAQNLPYLAKISDCNPDQILLRILLRDQNLDIMDEYLTHGKRGIPKLVVFSRDGQELGVWGPRPYPAAKLFEREIQAEKPKDEIIEKIHYWYTEDAGKTIETEIFTLLKNIKSRQRGHS